MALGVRSMLDKAKSECRLSLSPRWRLRRENYRRQIKQARAHQPDKQGARAHETENGFSYLGIPAPRDRCVALYSPYREPRSGCSSAVGAPPAQAAEIAGPASAETRRAADQTAIE